MNREGLVKADKEIQIMRSLTHQNIVQIIDYGHNVTVKKSKSKISYIVMELCEGGSLWDYLIMHGELTLEESF